MWYLVSLRNKSLISIMTRIYLILTSRHLNIGKKSFRILQRKSIQLPSDTTRGKIFHISMQKEKAFLTAVS